jgi:hypothetical protein
MAINPSYTSRNEIFSLSYPPTWQLKLSKSLPPSAIDFWTLTKGNAASVSAEFAFSLLESSSSATPLSCAAGVGQCQIISIDEVDYRLTATLQNQTSVQLKYEAVVGEHTLNISGTFKGSVETLPALLSEWEATTQSFKWRKTK